MLEKIEVGKTYLDEAGDKATVIFMGKNRLLYSWEDVKYHESSVSIPFAKAKWKELSEESRLVGQLYVCIKDGSYSKIGDPVVFPVGANIDRKHWRPCTLNAETGEVYSVE